MPDHPTIAALKATAPSIHSPLPWSVHSCLYNMRDAEGNATADVLTDDDAAHIAAAVNAAPHLLARVLELEAALEAARVAVAKWHASDHDELCWSLAPDARAAAEFGCTCGSDDNNRDRFAARLALGLEAGNV